MRFDCSRDGLFIAPALDPLTVYHQLLSPVVRQAVEGSASYDATRVAVKIKRGSLRPLLSSTIM